MRRWTFVLLTMGTLLLIYLGYGGLAAAILWFIVWMLLRRFASIFSDLQDIAFRLSLVRQKMDIQDRCIDDLINMNQRLLNILPPVDMGDIASQAEEEESGPKNWMGDSEWLTDKDLHDRDDQDDRDNT